MDPLLNQFKPMIVMPLAVAPPVLVMASAVAIYIHRNVDKFRRTATRIREFLEFEAIRRDSAFHRYRLPRDTAYRLGRLGLPFNYHAFLAANTAVAFFLALFSLKAINNPYLAAASPLIWMLFCHQLVDRIYRTRVKARIDSQVQLALQLLAEIYSVSDNLPQAVGRVIPSTPQPLRGDLEKLAIRLNTNEDLCKCLVEFAANLDNRDMETFVYGIILADQFGTDAHEVITKNAEVIRERIALREELINETRGKKAVIGIFMVLLPLVFLWLLISSGEARETFTGTAKGQCLIAVLAVVEYLCWYFDGRKGVAGDL